MVALGPQCWEHSEMPNVVETSRWVFLSNRESIMSQLDDNVKPGLVVFVRAGTHAELFE